MIPEAITGGIDRYVEYKLPPGHFLTAVIANDLYGACQRADDYNVTILPLIAAYARRTIPAEGYGSHQAIDAWLGRGR